MQNPYCILISLHSNLSRTKENKNKGAMIIICFSKQNNNMVRISFELLGKGDLKKETARLLTAAQEQAIRI